MESAADCLEVDACKLHETMVLFQCIVFTAYVFNLWSFLLA